MIHNLNQNNMNVKIFLLVATAFAFAFQQNKSANSVKRLEVEKGMIKVSIIYPNEEGKKFNWDYYMDKHVPMLKSVLGDSLNVISIDKGIAGRAPGSSVPYLAMCHMYFKSMASFKNSFVPNSEKLGKDVPNYTDIQPIVQISEVLE
jgi:uncharacterized protein (TIGR02118 family)